MLKNSFQHIPGIGEATEKQLWTSGLLSWEDITPDNAFKISPKRFETLTAYTKESFENFNKNNPAYFTDLIPSREHWRIFNEFRDSTAYIDIETTGIQWQ